MSKGRLHRIGDLQHAILKVLWEHGPSGVLEVHRKLEHGSELAQATVATMLRKMDVGGLVRHTEEGRKFIYAAAVDESQIEAGVADHVFERIFDGRLGDLVHHLLSRHDVQPEELKKARELIDKHVKRQKKPD